MLDSITLKHFYWIPPDKETLSSWQRVLTRQRQKYVFNEESGRMPKLTLLQTNEGLWHLSAAVSLPKMLQGHNSLLPEDVEVRKGLEMVSQYVQSCSNLPFDPASASVASIDYAHDLRLTEAQLGELIERLARRTLGAMDKAFVNDQSLYFTSKRRTRQFRIYRKFAEVRNKARQNIEALNLARGSLRFEHCLRDLDTIKAFMKRNAFSHRTVDELVNCEASNLAIMEIFDALQVADLLNNNSSDLEKLLQLYPANKAMTNLGFLEMKRLYGQDFYKDEHLGYSHDSYKRRSRECRLAGVG
jgi:hypothetical protein